MDRQGVQLFMLKTIRFICLIIFFILLIIGIVFILIPFLLVQPIWGWSDSRVDERDLDDFHAQCRQNRPPTP